MYDYIIVGAGSAGCVLAARLSADPGVSVLLLEAGPPDDADEIRAPAALNRLFQTAYDWNYLTVPQHRAGGRTVYWPRGKVLGGSSSINAMIYIRGNRHDFQTWGTNTAAPAGATRTSCRISAGPRTTPAAPARTTAPAAR